MEVFEGTMANIGQILLQLKVPESDEHYKQDAFAVLEGTGQLIKKIDDDRFLMLTSAHLFLQYDNVEPKPNLLQFKAGHFFLNRNGQNKYNCRFELDMKTVNIFGQYDESFPSVNGGDFAAVEVKLVYSKKEKEPQANFDQLKAHTFEDLKGQKLQVAGYPKVVLANVERYFLFQDEGEVQDKI